MSYIDLGAMSALSEKNKRNNKTNVKKFASKIFFVLFIIGLCIGAIKVVKREGLSALLNPVSIVSSFVNSSALAQSDGRTNILILGLDRRLQVTSGGLTDTIMLASLDNKNKKADMISIPRDLWVKLPEGSYSKANAAYALSGTDSAAKVVEEVLGVPIHYYIVIDFSAFKKVVEVLGGLDVVVEKAFDDYYYPIEGYENAVCGRAEDEAKKMLENGLSLEVIWPCRYKQLHFDAGLQRMDADTALEFSRSRKGDNGEGTDFARAKRQQKVMLAVRDKVLSLDTLANPAKLKELYDTYNRYVETNIGIVEVQKLYDIGKSVDFKEVKSLVLDDRSWEYDGGLLYGPEDRSLYGGQYVLIPKAGNYSQIHARVSKFLFGD